MDEKKAVCAVCGKEIKEYLSIGDNFLQQKYFDSEKDNVFCSVGCLCKSLSVLETDSRGTVSEYVPF